MKTVLIALVLLTWAGSANACRLALALALDVSGSVDETEYSLQLQGLADALSDPDVVAAIFAMPGAPVAVAVYEWSSTDYQRLVQDWVLLTDQAVLKGLVARLRGWQREPAPESTGIGAALKYGSDLIARGPSCWKKTLDVSGDGKNNDWPTPRDLKADGILEGVAVNGLVVVRPGRGILPPEEGELVAYYTARVIRGPDAFVEVARGFEDYTRAMRRKLQRELATQPLGNVPLQTTRTAGFQREKNLLPF